MYLKEAEVRGSRGDLGTCRRFDKKAESDTGAVGEEGTGDLRGEIGERWDRTVDVRNFPFHYEFIVNFLSIAALKDSTLIRPTGLVVVVVVNHTT
jgi:hypothetical protein